MSNEIGNLYFTAEMELVSFPLFFQMKENKFGIKRLTVLEEEKAKKIMSDPKHNVQVLNTKWKLASWEDQNKMMKQCQMTNDTTGQTEIDWGKYRDMRIKSLLVGWDITLGENDEKEKVAVTPEYIDKLPADLVLALYEKYNEMTQITDDEMGKS